MAVYALQSDMDRNQGKGVQLFIPGQTKLNDDDVFLGGPGTGVTDDMLGGGTRVFGNDSEGTAKAFDSFQKSNQSPFETNDIAAQIKAVTAANSAPRSDSYMGMPTGERLDMEQKQIQDAVTNAYNQNKFTYDKGQDAISNKYKQDTLDHTVSQDNFSNEYDVGRMMGNYKGQDTYEKTADAIKNAQFDAEMGYRYNALAASQARSSGGGSPSVSELNYQDKQNSQQVTAQAMSKLQEKANLGWTRDQVLNWMYSNSNAFMSAGVDMDNLAKLASSAYTWNGEDESRYK